MTSSHPRVSIGMPVYNAQRYLTLALDSILSQTLSDFELIISDNASTDATQDICTAYASRDSRIRYYRNATNLGAAHNHNVTVDLATAQYFKWAHYDDIWAPELLERCIEVLDNYQQVALCYAATKVIDERGTFVKDLKNGLNLRAPSPVDRYRAFHKRYRQGQDTQTGHIVLGVMRLETLKKTRMLQSIFSNDVVLLSELALLGEFCEVAEPLFFRRVHSESMFNKHTPQGVAIVEDASKRGRLLLPHWRLAFELARSLASSHLNKYDKLRCIPQIALWYKHSRRSLAHDLWLAAKHVMQVGPEEFRRTQ